MAWVFYLDPYGGDRVLRRVEWAATGNAQLRTPTYFVRQPLWFSVSFLFFLGFNRPLRRRRRPKAG
jgi:hypothetical protein